MKKLLYENKFSNPLDIDDFILDGNARITFPKGKIRMEYALDPKLMQKSNYVLWCKKKSPSNIEIEWNCKPISEKEYRFHRRKSYGGYILKRAGDPIPKV